MVIVNCVQCDSEFSTYPVRVRQGRAKYCSPKCGRPGKIPIICAMCGVEKLVFPAHAKNRKNNLCSNKCRIAWYRTGALRTPVEGRFWTHVVTTEDESCWEWQGAIDKVTGYGVFGVTRREQTTAHRVSWIINYGPIPDSIQVLHSCDHRPCVRPDHLFLGTQQDNIDDMIKKGRGHWQRKAA